MQKTLFNCLDNRSRSDKLPCDIIAQYYQKLNDQGKCPGQTPEYRWNR